MMAATDKKNIKFRSTKLSTIVGVSLVLFLVGMVLTAILGIDSIQKQARESLQGDLFFQAELNAADIKQVEQELKGWDCFKEVYFVSPERALNEFQGQDQNSKQIMEVFDGENPLPATVSFRPKHEFASKKGMNQIKQRLLKAFPQEIEEVNYDVNAVEEVNLGFGQMVVVTLLLAGLLIIIAVAMINNTIRLALFSQRFTIKTMQLVGAKTNFIRRPYMRGAMKQGIISSIIGMAMLMLVFFAVNNMLDLIEIELSLIQFLMLFGFLILCGIIITVFSTFFALNKYLRTKLDDLY